MFFKFVVVIFIATLFIDEASANACPRWVKLNKSPVCFEARSNQYGRFTYPQNIFVSSFMLVHRSGTASCNKKSYSYWGCSTNNPYLSLSKRIIKTGYWPQLHQNQTSMDGTIWQVTLPRPLLLCSVLPRSPTVSSPIPSCACGTEKTYVATQRVITAAEHAQMCMVCWPKLFLTRNLEH